ncbi:MAG: hypothetical protein IKW55_05850 [Bacteroidales bacterium]|nr:hypothetical protein [Bacteroidales bacterium]
MRFFRSIAISVLAVLAGISVVSRAYAQGENSQNGKQESKDSLVVLLSSKSAQMVDIAGASYRKVVGPARFLHNGTYLLCDTALWNVETKIIEAWGNVSILQDETVLTSDKLTYIIDRDLAEFRGSVVQLTDKDHNTLRTRHLDYNTADSVAIFQNGGAMRDKDGQIIESRNGTYDSKVKTFTFENNVNMFTDSIFVKTRSLIYESDKDLATFGFATDVWKDENMLSSNRGWYNRAQETFFFTDDVHLMSEDQEGWCDSLFFYRNTSNIDMLGNAQVTDTTRNIFGLAGRIEYVDSIAKVTMTRKPAVISETSEQDGSIDTLYLGAEKLVYYTLKMCDIDSLAVLDAQKRLKDLDVDPVGEFRRKAAEAAAKAAEEAAKEDPNYRPKDQQKGDKPSASAAQAKPSASTAQAKSSDGPAKPAGPTAGLGAGLKTGLGAGPTRSQLPAMQKGGLGRDSLMKSDSLMKTDSLMRSDSLPMRDSLPARDGLMFSDSLMVADRHALSDSPAFADSLMVEEELIVEEPKDTTKIGFLEAIRNVKIYKKDMQVVCDSLVYSDLDSLGRMFKNPIIWQDVTRQYTADSISVVVKNNAMEKASLMSNAFISIQEDQTHYDQIKGTEMLAYFDDNGALKRFDVLGGASALFYIQENDALATVNKPESKMLSATFKDGEIQRIYYFEAAKNDAYPIVQMSADEQQLKGFNWAPDKRPADRNAVTPLSLRPSDRKEYERRPRAQFRQTDIYFPGYMKDVYRQMEVRDSLKQVRERDRQIEEARAAAQARRDSIALADSLVKVAELAKADSIAVADSISKAEKEAIAVADSLKTVADTSAVKEVAEKVMTPEEIKAAEKAAKKAAAEKAKAEKKAAKAAQKKAKQEALEAKWAELDQRDANKAAEKAAKKLEKERKRKRKALESQAAQQRRDIETLEKYRLKFEQQKSRESKSGK